MFTMRSALRLVCLLLAVAPALMDSDFGNLKVLYDTVEKCSEEKYVGVCLKLKAVSVLDRALVRDDPLPLTDYIAIAKDPAAVIDRRQYNETESELADRLPTGYEEKSSALDQLLHDRIGKYLESRTVRLSIPSDVLEGRKKKDKGGYMMMGAMAMASMMIQMFIGKIALIAGKALLIGKIALLLSAIVGLKKLVGGGGGGEAAHPQVIYAHGNEHGGWRRSFSSAAVNDHDAQDMAYRAYK